MSEEYPGIQNLPDEVVYLMGCRTFEQFCSTLRSTISPKTFCPFCESQIGERCADKADRTTDWVLLRNEFPHKNTDSMWLIVPLRHLKDAAQLRSQDWVQVGMLFDRAIKAYRAVSGGFVMRYGHPNRHAGTIEHLHINLIAPRIGQEFRAALSKTEAERDVDYKRLLGFRDSLYERVHEHGTGWLFSRGSIDQLT